MISVKIEHRNGRSEGFEDKGEYEPQSNSKRTNKSITSSLLNERWRSLIGDVRNVIVPL